MTAILGFFRLIRSLNLLFIIITQCLFQYCVIVPTLKKAGVGPQLSPLHFFLLVLSSIFIAAAGYIINDYFDLNIDRINKPEKIIVEKVIRRRWAILWHLGLSLAGIFLSFYVGWKNNHNLILLFANSCCVFLLWVYSTTFKKKLLTGNIVISLLTGWTVLVLYVAELDKFFYTVNLPEVSAAVNRIFKLAVLYAGFAFIISLVREVVKDIEDMSGDLKYGCKTMPIVWGVNVSKVFAATWLIVLIAAIAVLQVYVMSYRWWISIGYSIVFILSPLIVILRKLYHAREISDYHRISSWIKWVMLTGILSLVFFCIYE